MQSSQYRSYKSHVPDYLHDRLKGTLVHCLERKSKALKYTKEDITVLHNEDGIFTVKGSKDKIHSEIWNQSRGQNAFVHLCRLAAMA